MEHQVLGSCIAGTASGIISQEKAKVTDCFANSTSILSRKDRFTIANSDAILSPAELVMCH